MVGLYSMGGLVEVLCTKGDLVGDLLEEDRLVHLEGDLCSLGGLVEVLLTSLLSTVRVWRNHRLKVADRFA